MLKASSGSSSSTAVRLNFPGDGPNYGVVEAVFVSTKNSYFFRCPPAALDSNCMISAISEQYSILALL
jgi:hypothetical protein